jgi:hypothetical protein
MKYIFLSLLVLLTSFSVKSQNSNLPYSEKDYLIAMNKVVNTISDLSNSYGEDTSVAQRLMDLSNNKVYALTFFNGVSLDGDTISSFVIKEWFVPTINSMSTYSPTTVKVIENDLDKWGVWFRVKVTDEYGEWYTIDMAINRENKISFVCL